MFQQFLNEDEFIYKITKKLAKKIDLSNDRIFQNFKNVLINQKSV